MLCLTAWRGGAASGAGYVGAGGAVVFLQITEGGLGAILESGHVQGGKDLIVDAIRWVQNKPTNKLLFRLKVKPLDDVEERKPGWGGVREFRVGEGVVDYQLRRWSPH